MAGVQEHGFYVLASTNEPEKIDPVLIQPQRLGIVVYCGLPDEEARLRILEMHTPKSTPQGEMLFSLPGAREIILKYIAEKTENFPPRQLGKIATNAKAILMERVSVREGKTQGLSEEDLHGATFTGDDWEYALQLTLEGFDLRTTIKRDKQIRGFVMHLQEKLGFKGSLRPNNSSGRLNQLIAAQVNTQIS